MGRKRGSYLPIILVAILAVGSIVFLSPYLGMLPREGGGGQLNLNDYGYWHIRSYDGTTYTVVRDDGYGILNDGDGSCDFADGTSYLSWAICPTFVLDDPNDVNMKTITFNARLLSADQKLYSEATTQYSRVVATNNLWGFWCVLDDIADIPQGKHMYYVEYESFGGQYKGRSEPFEIDNQYTTDTGGAVEPKLSDLPDITLESGQGAYLEFTYSTTDDSAAYEVQLGYATTDVLGDCEADGFKHTVVYYYSGSDLPMTVFISFVVIYDNGISRVQDDVKAQILPADTTPDPTSTGTTPAYTPPPDMTVTDTGGSEQHRPPLMIPDWAIALGIGMAFLIVVFLAVRSGGKRR